MDAITGVFSYSEVHLSITSIKSEDLASFVSKTSNPSDVIFTSKLAIVSKENEVQDSEIKEIKLKSNNPLAN